MQGRQIDLFVRFRDGWPDQVIPPIDREIDVEHVHVMTSATARSWDTRHSGTT